MASHSSSLVIQHSLTIGTIQGGEIIDIFSSVNVSKLYLSGNVMGSCKLYMLQLTEAYLDLLQCIESCITLDNNNGGFTVVGWYKRGIINDKSLVAT